MDSTRIICSECGHQLLLHCGKNGECEVRMLQPAAVNFDKLPKCGCLGPKEKT